MEGARVGERRKASSVGGRNAMRAEARPRFAHAAVLRIASSEAQRASNLDEPLLSGGDVNTTENANQRRGVRQC